MIWMVNELPAPVHRREGVPEGHRLLQYDLIFIFSSIISFMFGGNQTPPSGNLQVWPVKPKQKRKILQFLKCPPWGSKSSDSHVKTDFEAQKTGLFTLDQCLILCIFRGWPVLSVNNCALSGGFIKEPPTLGLKAETQRGGWHHGVYGHYSSPVHQSRCSSSAFLSFSHHISPPGGGRSSRHVHGNDRSTQKADQTKFCSKMDIFLILSFKI